MKFAALPAPVGDPAFDSSVSPDGRAVTMTFSDFIATADASKSPERTATRALSVIVPLENPDPTTAIEFGVSGSWRRPSEPMQRCSSASTARAE